MLDPAKFRPWAFRIARDQIYREYRRRKVPVQPLNETDLETLGNSGDEGSAVESEELHHCLQHIGPQHREALVLRFLEEMTYEDIARITGVTIGTVRSRIHYGKRALRSAWEERKI